MTSITTQTVTYPTDPLTAAEILAASTLIKAHPFFEPLFTPSDPTITALFAEINLQEPEKEFVQTYVSGPLKRKARALVYLIHMNRTYEVLVALSDPPAIGTALSLTYRLLQEVMYPNNNKDIAPVDDPFGGAQCFPYLTRQQLTQAVLDNKDLMCRLARRNVTRAMLTDEYPAPGSGHTQIYPYAFYTFEAFRNFIGARGCNCPDLIPLDAPNHRFMPAGFFDQTIVPGGLCIETANWGFVEGIYIIVDCTNRANPIFRIIEDGALPQPGLPPIPVAVQDPYQPAKHKVMKPLCTTMPNGVSFVVDDVNDIHYVKWDNWEFRWSYQRSGMSLYNVKYNDEVQKLAGEAVLRNILYKTAPSDTLVVYNAPDPIISRTYVSADSHNWPILHRLQPLKLGRDCPGFAKMYPVIYSDCKGNPVTINNAFAIYEEENDLLWRVNQGVIDFLNWPNGFDANGDPAGAPLTGCRQRKLVVRTIFSGFYYLFVYSYVFSQDGSFEVFCDLMGQTTNQWVEADTSGTHVPYGQRISKQLIALKHTHSCMWRMDWDLDGQNPNGSGNTAEEHNSFANAERGTYHKPKTGIVRIDGKKDACSTELGHCDTGMVNKCGQVIDGCDTHFHREKEAARQHNMKTNRSWSVHNPNSLNNLGFERGYESYAIGPNGNSVSLSLDDSPAHSHIAYLKNHFHVTRYRAGEEYACGEFPVLSNNACKPPGMSTYQANNEEIENQDIVTWHNAMFYHEPHTENYAFITKHRTGWLFTPENFFNYNQACSLEQETFPIFGESEADIIGECGAPTEFLYASCT